jgi:protein involved in temperature-dependent protein secretion
MTRGLAIALALFALNMGISTSSAWAQGAPQCADFPRLSEDTKKKADAVQTAMKAKADRKQVCALMTSFVASEAVVIKFLEDNKVWCSVPDQAIAVSKTNHQKSLKFRETACSADPTPQAKAPSLSDAIKTPSVDSAKNTSTGRGTFDTLTGNPLAR